VARITAPSLVEAEAEIALSDRATSVLLGDSQSTSSALADVGMSASLSDRAYALTLEDE